jgi:serine/threonine protein phosphatase PrpC
VGRKRRHNEDNFVAAPPVFAVADGMGGAQAGEVASELAASTVSEANLDPSSPGEERVVALIKAANLRVHERAATDPAASGMGTTMTVAILQPDGDVAIGHVGDSRAYRLRDDHLEQLTDDHSLVAELVRRGELTPQEAAIHPQRSVITRALGTEADVDVDVFTVETRDGDVFLLCSDGLTTMVDANTIARILILNRGRLEAATHALIKAANDRGGDDNITAILFAVADGDAELAEEPTVEHVGPSPDDEDTLHPEDNVRLPDFDEHPAEVTMVVSADELARALENQSPGNPPAAETMHLGAVPASDSHPGTSEAKTVPLAAVPAPDPHAAAAPVAEAVALGAVPTPEEAGEQGDTDAEPEEKASAVRLVIAGLLIIALSAAIIVLVLDALPR